MSTTSRKSANRLSDTQLVILASAAGRTDLRVMPVLESVKAHGAALTRSLQSLLKRGFLVESPAETDDVEWRRDDEGAPLTLKISEQGLASLGIEGPEGHSASHTQSRTKRTRPVPLIHTTNAGATKSATDEGDQPNHITTGLRPDTKGTALVAALSRANGASTGELMAISGWQHHSVRGFLSGTVKKKLGLAITSAVDADGERRYRIEN